MGLRNLTGIRGARDKPTDSYACPVSITPVDTVVLLSKGEADSKKVRVEFSLEDMDMSDLNEKAI